MALFLEHVSKDFFFPLAQLSNSRVGAYRLLVVFHLEGSTKVKGQHPTLEEQELGNPNKILPNVKLSKGSLKRVGFNQ